VFRSSGDTLQSLGVVCDDSDHFLVGVKFHELASLAALLIDVVEDDAAEPAFRAAVGAVRLLIGDTSPRPFARKCARARTPALSEPARLRLPVCRHACAACASVTSLLFGIAQAKASADAGNLDRPVLDVFKKYSSIANVDDRKRSLTLRHLMTMRTSMDFWEQPYPGSPLDQLNRSSDDWVKFVLDRPMTGTPGSAWAYNSGAAIAMGGVIRELSGRNVDDFARSELFEPIGATGETWARSPYDGLPHCGGGLNLKATDLARVGYLVLRHGRWGDREIVPRAWLDLTTAPVTRGSPVFFSSYGSAYGYFWWLFPTRRGGTDTGIIAASGSGGQWLFVIPSLDLVVAIVAAEGNGLDLLYDGILAALQQ